MINQRVVGDPEDLPLQVLQVLDTHDLLLGLRIQDHEIAIFKEVAQKYDFDGLLLDRGRYDNIQSDFSGFCHIPQCCKNAALRNIVHTGHACLCSKKRFFPNGHILCISLCLFNHVFSVKP